METAQPYAEHPRQIGWLETAALAMGGSNQSLFIVGALVAAQGTAAVPLLVVGLVLAWAALPGWTELVCMWPNRVGGIAAACAEAFRPYSPVLANLTGVSYWWGWIPTCGLTAILSAQALHTWYLPAVPATPLALGIITVFTVFNLRGIRWATRSALVIGAVSAILAFMSGLLPLVTGHVDWHRATSWQLRMPFHGAFGALTSAMAGLYLIGFAAPAFEAAACHVGETRDPVRNVPRAMLAAAAMATVFFLLLPLVWLGVIGPHGLAGDLASTLQPTFAPLAVSAAKAAAVGFMVFNMFHGTLQPLAGAARTLSQLADDALLPRSLSRRNRFDAPWVATVLTAVMSSAFLLSGDPPSVIAAANFTYLIGICLPSVAVFLLRRNHPDWGRPWRAPRGTIVAGALAALCWGLSTIFGFEQFGLSYVLLALVLAYSGAVAFAWRQWRDRVRAGRSRRRGLSLHAKLTGAMVIVMALDGVGYLTAIHHVGHADPSLVTVLQDIFVAVALLTVTVGLVLPGIVAHAVTQVGAAARALTQGTLTELTDAMVALGDGRLEEAHAQPRVIPIDVRSRDEVGAMAREFEAMQGQVARAASALDAARVQLHESQSELRFLADHDPLTGLANRRRFDAELARQIDRNRRYGGASALILIDVDEFKLINDTRGHSVGDAVIRRIGAVLRDRLRSSDVLARLGGDEFAVILPSIEVDKAVLVAKALLDDIAERTRVVDPRGERVRVQASAGVACFVGDTAASAESVLIDADVAMYDAKESGRNRVALAGGGRERRTQLETRQMWVETIRTALDEGQFVLWGQPIVDITTGAVVRQELLLRLVRGNEVLAPGTFLPIAERVGLIADIDGMVVRHAFALLRDEVAAGRRPHYSINLSGASITNSAVVELIEQECARSDLHDGAITIEITETAAIVNIDDARAFAERLGAAGCRLSLDDFGSGFGSFYYLKHLPFDTVKIDGDFVRNLPDSRHDQQVVRAIVTIARGLGLSTVAEFVENAKTLEILAEIGVDQAQGYHLGRPAPLDTDGAPARRRPLHAVDAPG